MLINVCVYLLCVLFVFCYILSLQALEIREACNCPPLSEPDPRLVFKLAMKDFLQESEKKDLNTTVKKKKVDPLPIGKQKQISGA